MPKCGVCGMIFARAEELEEHGVATHNFTKEESSLLRKAGQKEKARRRSRGPYRKARGMILL